LQWKQKYLNASNSNTGINIGQTINYNGPLAGVYAFIGNNEFILQGGTSNYGFTYTNMSYLNFTVIQYILMVTVETHMVFL
jgi:hypothetical protein